MSDKPLLVISDHSGNESWQENLTEWAEQAEEVEPWCHYDIMVMDHRTTVGEVPKLDELADAVADRVVARLFDGEGDE